MNDSQLIKVVIREIEKKLDWKEKASHGRIMIIRDLAS
jgi:hypothetical protein